METEKSAAAESKGMYWTGWVLSILVVALMLLSATMKLTGNKDAVEGFKKAGYPDKALMLIGIAEVTCAVLYIIPKTSVLGAILVTGYLGGATNHHVRMSEAVFIAPVIIGMVAWLGIFLRDRRIRALLPLKS